MKHTRHVLVLAVLALFAVAGPVYLGSTDDDSRQPTRDVAFTVNEGAGDGVPSTTIKIAEPVIKQAGSNLEDLDSRDETPVGASPSDIQGVQDQVEKVQRTLVPLPLAGASADIGRVPRRED